MNNLLRVALVGAFLPFALAAEMGDSHRRARQPIRAARPPLLPIPEKPLGKRAKRRLRGKSRKDR